MATNNATNNATSSNGKPNGKAKATANKNVFTGPNVTAPMLVQWLNGHCGGNYGAVTIVPLPNCNPNSANPLPYTNMAKPGRRYSISWAIVKGAPVPNGKPSFNLAIHMAYSAKHGQTFGTSGKSWADLLAALNGGFSTGARTYGVPYVQLVYTPPAAAKAAPKAAPKAAKAKAAPKAAQPQPQPQPSATATAPAPAATAPAPSAS